MGFLNNFFGMNPTVETAVTKKDDEGSDVFVTALEEPSTSAMFIAPATNDTIEIYEQLRAEALKKRDTATADIYQTLIDEEREHLEEEAKAAAKKKEEEAKAAAKKKAEEEKRRREAAETAARKKAEEEKRRREAAEAAAKQKAEEEKRRRAEEAAKAEFEAKARAIDPLLAYFTEDERRARRLIKAIADTKYGEEAILNYAATAKE